MLSLTIVTIPPFATDSINISPKPNDFNQYEYGSNVTVRIIPKAGWEITGWDGQIAGISDSVNIIIKNDVHDTVHFLPIKASSDSDIIYVNKDALQNGGGVIGSSWVDAYRELNAALAVSEGKTVWVAKGKYTPIDVNTSFTLRANSSVIGGFAGTESTAEARDSVHNTTILSGQINSTEKARAVANVPLGADNVCLSTFTIEGAYGSIAPYGGVYATDASNLTLFRCIVQNNYPRAITAGYKNKILQCAIVNNNGLAGVGVQVEKDSVFIINTVINNNNASTNGAGVYVTSGMHAILINNTIIGNTTSNSGDGRTAGIYHPFSSTTQTLISNCIIRGNTVLNGTHTKGTQISFTDTVYNSNIQDTVNGTGIGIKLPGWPFSGTIDEDPLFVNSNNLPGSDGYYFTDDDGLMLSTSSPSINTGGDIYAHDEWIPTVDIRGKSRLNNLIDMGAYEQ